MPRLREIASRMYLCGIAAVAETAPPGDEQIAKAAEIEDAVRQRLDASGERWRQIDLSLRRRAAAVTHAFDEVCRTVGVSAEVVASSHGLSELPLDEFRRVRPVPADLKTWADFLLKLWFDEVGSVADDLPLGR